MKRILDIKLKTVVQSPKRYLEFFYEVCKEECPLRLHFSQI